MDPLTITAIASAGIQGFQSVWNFFSGMGKIDQAKQDLGVLEARKANYSKEIDGINTEFQHDMTKVNLSAQSQDATLADRGVLGPSADALVKGNQDLATQDLEAQRTQNMTAVQNRILMLDGDINSQKNAIDSAGFANTMNLVLGLGASGLSFFEKSFNPNTQSWGWDKGNKFKAGFMGDNYDPIQNKTFQYTPIGAN
jgi:hypothetical protein